LQISMVSSAETWCGDASSSREPSSNPADRSARLGTSRTQSRAWPASANWRHVKVFKRGRIQKQRLQGHWHYFNSNIRHFLLIPGLRITFFRPAAHGAQNYFACSSFSQSSMWPRERSRLSRALASSNPHPARLPASAARRCGPTARLWASVAAEHPAAARAVA